MKKVPFSPPDITESEVNLVSEALRSGWITTGPKTKEFERKIAEYCHTDKAVAGHVQCQYRQKDRFRHSDGHRC